MLPFSVKYTTSTHHTEWNRREMKGERGENKRSNTDYTELNMKGEFTVHNRKSRAEEKRGVVVNSIQMTWRTKSDL